MNKRNTALQTYSIHRQFILAADSTSPFTFELSCQQRAFMLRSIAFNYMILGDPDNSGLYREFLNPVNNGSFIRAFLGDSEQIHTPILESSMSVAPVAGADFNGVRFYIHNPGQWFFTSWHVTNILPVRVDMWNDDPIGGRLFQFDLLFETEILAP